MSNWLQIQIEAVDAIGKAEPLEYLQIAAESGRENVCYADVILSSCLF